MIRKQHEANMSMLTLAAREIGIEHCNYQVTCKVPDREEFIRGVTSMCSGKWVVIYDHLYESAPLLAFGYFEQFEDALAVDLANG